MKLGTLFSLCHCPFRIDASEPANPVLNVPNFDGPQQFTGTAFDQFFGQIIAFIAIHDGFITRTIEPYTPFSLMTRFANVAMLPSEYVTSDHLIHLGHLMHRFFDKSINQFRYINLEKTN